MIGRLGSKRVKREGVDVRETCLALTMTDDRTLGNEDV